MPAQWPTWQEERHLRSLGCRLVAGVDEVGRGPLAGPVVAAAIVLPQRLNSSWLRRVRDSKAVAPREREYLCSRLCDAALSFGVGAAEAEEIDRVNVLEATRRAMLRAVGQLQPPADFLLVDAVALPGAGLPFKAIVHGDALCVSIAAASIVAKVTRDRIMAKLDEYYPGYGFAQHKGYPTPAHHRALARLGPSPIHRRSYRPVRQLVEVGDAGTKR